MPFIWGEYLGAPRYATAMLMLPFSQYLTNGMVDDGSYVRLSLLQSYYCSLSCQKAYVKPFILLDGDMSLTICDIQ